MWINLVEKLSESRGPKTAQLAENSPDRNWGRIGRWRKALSYLALAKRQAMRKDLVVQGQNKDADAAEKLRRKKQQRKQQRIPAIWFVCFAMELPRLTSKRE